MAEADSDMTQTDSDNYWESIWDSGKNSDVYSVTKTWKDWGIRWQQSLCRFLGVREREGWVGAQGLESYERERERALGLRERGFQV
jgi:hypothetical protein